MPELITQPHLIPVPRNKISEEFIGRVNNRESQTSIARMRSPAGWSEPGQTPEFDEFTVVLNGAMRVEYKGGVMEVGAGQAFIARKGEWVR
jgi:ethanolamine utilization protein EutQ